MISRERENIQEALGETINRWMAEPDTTDVILNPPLEGEDHGRIWVTRLGHHREPVGFMPADQAMRLIGMVASTMKRSATADTPSVEGTLITDGSRFQACIPPNTPGGPFFAIRRKAIRVFPFEEYVAHGLLKERQREIIEDAIRKRLNIVVVGGTGSGKTTFLNAIIDAMTKIHPHHRFFGIEEVSELQCTAPDRTFTLTSASMSIRDLVKMAMRSFADRILIGEARGPEMLDVLMAWNTGHPGGAATVHCDVTTPEAALDRIELLLLLANPAPLHRLVARAVGLIVCLQLDEDTGARRVTQIVRVHGHDGQNYNLTTET
jgi:P-type conjugative transfer ATPase TrbB